VDKLLTASGRVPADVWRAAVAAGRSTGTIGDYLIGDGHISRNELALSVLSTLMDAAFFLFDAAVSAQFEPDAVNPLGPYIGMEFAAVCAEVDRRRRLLTDIWPDPEIDTAAVVPARRLRGHQVSLTAAQWEIVANADRRRSPADLARLLGRETFVMLLEARRLARSGLIEPGRPGGSAVAESVAAVRARTAAALVQASEQRIEARTTVPLARGSASVPVVTATVPPPPAPGPASPGLRNVGSGPGPAAPGLTSAGSEASASSEDAGPQPGVPLPRRRAAEHRWPASPADDGRGGAEECSESTLMRIQRALRALR
jgi:hypothetical protein